MQQALAKLPPPVAARIEVATAKQRPLPTAVVAAGMLLVLRRLLRRKVTAMLKVHTLRPERPLEYSAVTLD
jgi:hypothetical protein